ncbi:ABC transporter substrate-binding protein [Paenibacillus xerothermodurans]|uniref:Sugar ABC transporter substrate-binding protein n=1 Tax=Paenibacillus xerothermodurans TaxID=1977292 RepID=A0A2W1NM33_PAEXE|nr:sugar ABC transporter substrate-binding protein [Paenibacillus xerothermodurans]PZE20003.1 sugar ABC transporter substrate-binding protein [Paenibacillus xerothermodurans]
MPKVKGALLLTMSSILAATVVLTGCSDSEGSAQDGTSPQTGAAGETTLTFWTFNAIHQKFYEDAAKRWNEANPNKKVILKATTYPFDDMHNKLLLSLQSGVGAPDIADIEIGKFSNYLKGNKPPLAELNDIVDPVKANMVQSRLDIYSKNDKVYGLPTHVGAEVMYYNKEIMDQAGVNVDDIKTWDDYFEAGKKVLAATGKPITTVESRDPFSFTPFILQQGSDYFDKDGQVILDNEINIKTLQFMRNMLDEKIAIVAPGGDHHAEEYYGFMNTGGAASLAMPVWYMGRFTQYMPDLKGKMVIRPLPAWTEGGKRSSGMGGTGTVVTAQSKHVALAKEFLAHVKLSEEGNKRIWTDLGFDPPRWDVWTAPEMKSDNQFTAYFGNGIFDVLLQIKDEIDSPRMHEKTPLAVDLLKKNVMFKVLEEKSATPEQALKEAADELRR